MSLRAALVAPLLLVAACGPSEERTSDIALHEAIERLRNETETGATTRRRARLATVLTLPARTAAATDARSACGGAYRKLLDAEDGITLAELQMKAAEAMRAPPGAAVAGVLEAEVLLAAAREAMPACDLAAARLAIAAR